MKYTFLPSQNLNVLPTPTTLQTIRVKQFHQLTVEVENLDGSQTVSVEVWRRCSDTGSWSYSNLSNLFDSIQPGSSVCVDMDVTGCVDVQLRATASGVGLTLRMAGLLVEGWL